MRGSRPAGASQAQLRFARMGVVALSMLAVMVAVSAATSWSRSEDAEVDLVAPAGIPDEISRTLLAVASGSGGGATPASLRRTVLPPTPLITSDGPCATQDEPKCAVVAMYDYATHSGMHVTMTLTDPPVVVSTEIGKDIVIDLSPEESSRGFVIAEMDPGVQAWLADGYHREYTHQFAPEPFDDPCLELRCVAVDYTTSDAGKQPLKTAIVDLTNGKVVQRSGN